MSALADLFDRVKAKFAVEIDPTVSVVFGEREVGRQINQGLPIAQRVVFCPVEVDDIGAILPARGGTDAGYCSVTHIGRLEEKCTVYVWAIDENAHDPDVEKANYNAVRSLFGNVFMALFQLAAGRIAFSKVSRVSAKGTLEKRLGAEWMFAITVRDDLTAQPVQQSRGLIPDAEFGWQSPA